MYLTFLKNYSQASSHHQTSVKHQFGTDSYIIDVLSTSSIDGYSGKVSSIGLTM